LTPLGLGWPNIVSVARVFLAPFLVVLIAAQDRNASYLAAAIFIARTGQWLDPLADKILVAAPVLTLAALGEFPVWAAALIVARELTISLLRVLLGLRGRGLPASSGAKAKTTLQLAAITLYILPLGAGWDGLRLGLLIAAVVLTVGTGVQYVAQAIPWLRRPARPPVNRGTGA